MNFPETMDAFRDEVDIEYEYCGLCRCPKPLDIVDCDCLCHKENGLYDG